MNKRIIIQIPFNVQGFNKKNESDKQWIRYRLGIFRKYCMGSLTNQTNQYFKVLLRVRDHTLAYIMDIMRGKLPENFCIVGNNYAFSIRRLIENYNYLYLVRMDSDDCYDKDFIDMLHNHIPKKDIEVLISQNCYDYDVVNNRLAKFWYRSPQSYTLVYDVEEYKKNKRYFLKNGHGGAILLKHELLNGYNYLNTIHRRNNECSFHDSDTTGRKGVKEITDKNEKNSILKRFGIEAKNG